MLPNSMLPESRGANHAIPGVMGIQVSLKQTRRGAYVFPVWYAAQVHPRDHSSV